MREISIQTVCRVHDQSGNGIFLGRARDHYTYGPVIHIFHVLLDAPAGKHLLHRNHHIATAKAQLPAQTMSSTNVAEQKGCSSGQGGAIHRC
jgi:hypothetical protein